jgi:hypothetical protein
MIDRAVQVAGHPGYRSGPDRFHASGESEQT